MPKMDLYSAHSETAALRSKPRSVTLKIDVASLPKPDSLVAVDQIKAAVKKFRSELPSGNKLSLGQTYNQVAKALGFKCWDAILAAARKPQERPIAADFITKEDNELIIESTQQTPPHWPVPPANDTSYTVESLAPSQEDFLAAIAQEPYLTHNGIRYTADWRKTVEENRQEFLDQRSELEATGLEQFRRCCEWLKGCKKIKTLNTSMGSYTLKHRVERWATRRGVVDYYVSNGTFIAAAIHCGFTWKWILDTPNVWLNISKRSPALREE